MPPLKSSNLKSAEYDAEKRHLIVSFHSGKIYRFQKVPEFHFANLLKAHSAGKYFSSRIRGTFTAEDITGNA